MASRKIFSLFGAIAIEGMAATKKEFTAFDKEARALTKQLNLMGKEAVNVGKTLTSTLTVGITAAATGAILAANATGKYADKLHDLEQITGLSTDNLQGLEKVATEAGVNFDGLTNVISKFTSRLPRIMSESGAASDAIKALGVNVFDSNGSVRDMNDLFPEMITKLQGITDVTDRNVIAQQIFGRSLRDLAPVLGLSQEKFTELFGSAQDFAGYMSADALNAADEYRVSVEKLQKAFLGVSRDISSALIPILKDSLIPLLKNDVLPIVMSIVGAVKSAAEWFNNLASPIKEGILLFAGLMAVAGPVLLLYGKLLLIIKPLVPLFLALTKGQLALNVAMSSNPIGLIVVGIAALITAGVLLIRHWDAVKTAFINTWDTIKHYFFQASNSIGIAYLTMIEGLLDGLSKVTQFIPKANKAVDSLRDSVRRQIDTLQNLNETAAISRAQQKLSVKMTKEETAVIEEAKKEVTDYTINLDENTKEKVKNTKATKDEIDAEFELLKERVAFSDQWNKKAFAAVATREQALEHERQLALSEARRLGADTAAIEEYYALERAKSSADLAAKKIADEKKVAAEAKAKAKETLDFGVSTMSTLNDTWAQSIDLRMSLIDEQAERDKKAVEFSVMNEEQKAAAIAAIDEGADAKKLELQRENARREKLMAIFSIILNTAMAISKAYALGPPQGIVFGVIMGILGAIQIAIAAAQPMPFAEGGLVRGDPSGGGVVAQIGEGGQDELVLPMKTGAAQLAENLMSRMGMGFKPSESGAAGKSMEQHTHLHIGTLIADELGLKNLERTLRKYRISEQQRTLGYGTA